MDSPEINFQNKLQGLITREVYWEMVRDKLRLLSEISSFLGTTNIEVIMKNAAIFVLYKIRNSEESFHMKLFLEDTRSVPFLLLAEKEYEDLQSKIMHKLFEASRNFSDIGANMGFYSLYASKLSPTISVFAFEPNSAIRNILKENIDGNFLKDRITIIPTALGNSNLKNQKMFIPKFTGTGGGSFKNLHPEEQNEVIDGIEVMMLDTYAEDNDYKVDMMKIDVEGFEMSVIEGAEKVIARFQPTIVIELLRKWMKPFGHTPQDVLNYLSKLGYLCFEIGEEKLFEITRIDELTIGNNFVFIHCHNDSHLKVLYSSGYLY
jgi:FkbM family methyltransferase